VTRTTTQPITIRLAAIIICLVSIHSVGLRGSLAQNPAALSADRIELYQALLDLNSPWTVMCVAAHPDDEDGTTLTVLRRKYGVHTVSLFSTYGEGGQNAVGPELYEELGVIRARETMNASRIQGSEPYFLGLKDFGFSKSADEAFREWGHDEALKRMVLKIRELRPDAIITNHDTTSGHGHHQATGRLILEAFEAAADASRFPEQLNTVSVWQPKRLFVRTRRAASNSSDATAAKTITIDPNEIDPARGTSYGEQALSGLQQHASQGPWPKSVKDWLRAQNNQTGKLNLIRYQLVKEAANTPPLPAESTTPINALQISPSLASRLAPTVEGKPLTDLIDQPKKLLDALIDWRLKQSRSPVADDAYRLRLIEMRISKALELASHLSIALKPSAPVLVPGTNTAFTINLDNGGDRGIKVVGLTFEGEGVKQNVEIADLLLPETEATVTVEHKENKDEQPTVPSAAHLYDGKLFGEPVSLSAEFEVEGARFFVQPTLTLDVVPAVEIESVTPSPCVRTNAAIARCKAFNLRLRNHLPTPFRGFIKTRVGADTWISPEVAIPANQTRNETVLAKRAASLNISIESVASGVPVTERSVEVVTVNALVKPRLRVGYVPSFDQTIEASLAALGVESKALNVNDIANGDLKSFDTIIIDNRGYEAHPELIAANSRLLEYVQAGGNLVVFYHKDNEWNPDERKNRPQLAPYKLILGGERVTVETAPVKFLLPRHRLLNYPNRITAADFNDWIQERGLYYPKEWDPQFEALLSSGDPGEQPLTGGLLVAKYGSGSYIYTSMVWYRQLREGIPGGYRMFANMISYGK
jgi:LmbE family N-acetylglucosaminyl deacetylase